MKVIAPQHSDLVLEFNNLQFNTLTEELDLDNVDNLVLSVAKGSPSATTRIIINRATMPQRFEVDNVNKTVSVKLLSSDISDQAGLFYVNLYLYSGGERVTHLSKILDVQKTVRYEV